MRIVKLDEASMKNILADMLKRDPNNYDAYTETVQEIVDRVKAEGDAAVFDYTKKFDKAEINADNIRVTEAEIKEAMEAVDPHLLEVMKKSMENIRRYHEKQRRNSWFDSPAGRHDLRTEDHSIGECRCVCTWRQSCLSFFCTYEHYPGRGSWCKTYCYGHTSWKRWQGKSCYFNSSTSGRCNRSL